jgi:hypothetical protein
METVARARRRPASQRGAEERKAHIAALVDAAPPLVDEQVECLRLLLVRQSSVDTSTASVRPHGGANDVRLVHPGHCSCGCREWTGGYRGDVDAVVALRNSAEGDGQLAVSGEDVARFFCP